MHHLRGIWRSGKNKREEYIQQIYLRYDLISRIGHYSIFFRV